MLAVTGFNTTIVKELQALVTHERIIRMTPAMDFDAVDRYLFAAGILHQKPLAEQTAEERGLSLTLNLEEPLYNTEEALRQNRHARVVLIGSESAYQGSYDEMYAAMKCGLHRYVELRKVLPTQFLGLISPPIIADSGMTMRRHDFPEVLKHRRHVFAGDVAAIAYRMLYQDALGQNVVERM